MPTPNNEKTEGSEKMRKTKKEGKTDHEALWSDITCYWRGIKCKSKFKEYRDEGNHVEVIIELIPC